MTSSIDAEIAQGKAMVDNSLANGIKFFVYPSVDRGGEEESYETKTKIPHFISKYDIEHRLVEKSKGKMEWTILRPCTFMDVCLFFFFFFLYNLLLFHRVTVFRVCLRKLTCRADACTRLSRQGNGHQLEDRGQGQASAADIFY